MNIAIAGDHAGFELKQQVVTLVSARGHEVLDLGAHAYDGADDHPDFGFAVADAVRDGRAERGIAICGSGVGVCLAANRVPGIFACVCHDTYTAAQGVEHDGMNVLCLGGRVVGINLAEVIVDAFLGAEFQPEDRFVRRVDKIRARERG
jgi:ribose 5-phosphate isomerase B